jgi:hypothetical protein
VKVLVDSAPLELVLQGIYDVLSTGKCENWGDLEAIKGELHSGLDEARVERVQGTGLIFQLTTPKRLTDLLDGLKEWKGGPGFVAFYGQRTGRGSFVDELAPVPWATERAPSAAEKAGRVLRDVTMKVRLAGVVQDPGPPPVVITSAQQFREVMGWSISDEEFERRFPKAPPPLPLHEWPEDQGEQVTAAMDPNDPKRVLVTMQASAPPERHFEVRTLVDPTQPILAALRWTKDHRVALEFTDEPSRLWAAFHEPEIADCMAQLTREHGGRPIVLTGNRHHNPPANPHALFVGELLALAAGALRAAFPETPLVIAEYTS